jgi:hypothetical protein
LKMAFAISINLSLDCHGVWQKKLAPIVFKRAACVLKFLHTHSNLLITADNYKNWLVNGLIWIETKTNREDSSRYIILSMGLIKAVTHLM